MSLYNGVHGHDAMHQGGWDSCGEVSNQDVGEGYVVFKGRDVFGQGGGIRIVLCIFLHALCG